MKISKFYEYEGKSVKRTLDAINSEIEEAKEIIEDAIKTGSEDITIKKTAEHLIKLIEVKKQSKEYLKQIREKYEQCIATEKEEKIKNGN